jgi:hypothetical protein
LIYGFGGILKKSYQGWDIEKKAIKFTIGFRFKALLLWQIHFNTEVLK